ncbi:MAG: hypothetical protein ACRDN0_05390 [Trebonia sp.]
MEDTERAELDQGIQVLLTEYGLNWVRANIDEGVADRGSMDVLVTQGHEYDQAPLFGEDAFQYVEALPGKKGQRMVGNVPLLPAARLELTIAALRRLIIELPEIHEEALRRLAESNDHDSMVETLRFLPDEDDGSQPVPGLEEVNTPSRREARRAAGDFLGRLIREATRG